ncbi:hypothetical protein D9758_011692 [Tetrapyrgos nigripes]|uniref:Myb/SANT-like domain-containing protein n=1 Tax=Tetrapyrgos nigripes TaxID=182062 RepID=A0A8H5LML7_9AGAR|nr:hypothetical protein D9758_011692 [Tetrapyrgos nigripes]
MPDLRDMTPFFFFLSFPMDAGAPPVSAAPASTDEPDSQDIWNGDVDNFILTHLEQVKKDRKGTRDQFGAAVWTNLSAQLQSAGHHVYSNDELKDRFHLLKKSKTSTTSSAPRPLETPPTSHSAAPLPSISAPLPYAAPSSANATAAPSVPPPPSTAHWTPEAEALLIEHLVEAKAKGQMSENNFKPSVYQSAAAYLREKGYNFTKTQVKGRWTRFKKRLQDCSEAQNPVRIWMGQCSQHGHCNRPGMGCLHQAGVDSYSKGHSKAGPFRNKPFPHYDDIASKRRAVASTPAPKRVRVSAGAQALENMSTAFGSLAEGMKSGAFMAAPVTDSPIKKEQAFNIVRAEEGLSPHSLAKARRVFRGSGEIAREFLSFDPTDENKKEARHCWLLDEMEQLHINGSVFTYLEVSAYEEFHDD